VLAGTSDRLTLTDEQQDEAHALSLLPLSPPPLSFVAPGSSAKRPVPHLLFSSHDSVLASFSSTFSDLGRRTRFGFGHFALPVEQGQCPILSSPPYTVVFDAPRSALYGVEQLFSQAPRRMSGTNTTIQDTNPTFITYSAGWIYNNSDARYDSSDHHATTKFGSTVTVRFEGNGIE